MENFMVTLSDGAGVQIAVITAVVAAASVILRAFAGKIPDFIVRYAPLALSVVFAVITEAIGTHRISFSEETLSVAVLSYSAGTIVSVAVKRIFHGEKTESPLFMLIEGIIAGLVTDNPAAEIAELVLRVSENGISETEKNLTEIMRNSAKDGVTEADISAAVRLILLSADRLLKKK